MGHQVIISENIRPSWQTIPTMERVYTLHVGRVGYIALSKEFIPEYKRQEVNRLLKLYFAHEKIIEINKLSLHHINVGVKSKEKEAEVLDKINMRKVKQSRLCDEMELIISNHKKAEK